MAIAELLLEYLWELLEKLGAIIEFKTTILKYSVPISKDLLGKYKAWVFIRTIQWIIKKSQRGIRRSSGGIRTCRTLIRRTGRYIR